MLPRVTVHVLNDVEPGQYGHSFFPMAVAFDIVMVELGISVAVIAIIVVALVALCREVYECIVWRCKRREIRAMLRRIKVELPPARMDEVKRLLTHHAIEGCSTIDELDKVLERARMYEEDVKRFTRLRVLHHYV